MSESSNPVPLWARIGLHLDFEQDPQLLYPLADALEDAGKSNLARGVREIIQKGYWPAPHATNMQYEWYANHGPWCWITTSNPKEPYEIPPRVSPWTKNVISDTLSKAIFWLASGLASDRMRTGFDYETGRRYKLKTPISAWRVDLNRVRSRHHEPRILPAGTEVNLISMNYTDSSGWSYSIGTIAPPELTGEWVVGLDSCYYYTGPDVLLEEI